MEIKKGFSKIDYLKIISVLQDLVADLTVFNAKT